MESLEKHLYDVFKNFQGYERSSSAEYYLSASGIEGVLTTIYHGRIHTVGIDAPLNYSPASCDEINGVLACIAKFKEIVRMDCQELKKPVVSFWKINISGKNPSQRVQQAQENYIWQLMVIFPKNYTNFDEEPLSNTSELVYMIDSSGNNHTLPGLMKFLLKTQISYTRSNGISNTFGGIFPSAIICDALSIKQHENPSQSWLWLIFNTVMLISSRNCNYLNEFSNFDVCRTNKILAIFEDLGINFSKWVKIANFWRTFSSEWLEMIEKAILTELRVKLSSWLIFEDQANFLANNLNINQLCLLVEYKDNNKEDDALQFIYSLRRSQELDSDTFKTPNSIRINQDESLTTPQSVIKVKTNCSFETSSADFIHIVRGGNIFIDKTIFIKAILENSTYKIAILRPRGWGKSVNMSMLQAFLNPQIGESEEFSNLYLFTGERNNANLDNLDNEKCKNIMKIDDGKYRNFAGTIPTILFRFPEILTLNAETSEEIKNEISKTLRKHISSYRQYLKPKISHSSINKDFKKLTLEDLDKIIDQQKIDLPKEMKLFRLYLSDSSKIDIYTALNDLVTMLYMIHGRHVIFIIDDYDSIYKQAAVDAKHEQEIILLLRRMLYPLVYSDDDYIRKIIVTGVYYDLLLTIFPGQFFAPFTVLNELFSDFFGFTESEVDELLEHHLVQDSHANIVEQKKLIKQWYDGYRVGSQKIYNPFSIMCCLWNASLHNVAPLQTYWHNEEDEKIFISVFNTIESHNKIFEIMKAGYLRLDRPIYQDTRIRDNVCVLFLYAGYLTPHENKPNNLVYVVPNKEIKRYFYENLFTAWINKVSKNDNINHFAWVNKYIDCLENKEQLQNLIQTDLLDNISDNSSKNEAFFQTYTGGIALIALEKAPAPKYKFHVEKANQFGKKTDGIFIPIPGESSTIIIHELKKLEVAHKDKVQERADDALWQIYSKKYMDIALSSKESHFRNVIIRGIVFYRSPSKGNWEVFIKEHQFSYHDAVEVDKYFRTADGKILPQYSVLCRDNCRIYSTEMARDKLGGNDIDELIEKIISKDPSLANIDKTYQEETLKRKIDPGAEGIKKFKKGK
ncbi:unnamed protein product [Blepharisma stoltei]|uniref:AAA-ATPase-like domain-containing protein n=1 Tax=Blepharisma stoltei TaxID=1481888 RepID=A0AAU9JN64_9CILI|nr:unnamed protein product [Blepharisma stoltei]